MRTFLIALSVVSLATVASAQTPIILGPNSLFAWDVVGTPPVTVAVAASLTYNLTVDSGTPAVLANVTCVAPVAPATNPTCSVLASTLPLGSHSLTLTDSSGGVTSLPSTPFAYVVIAIPLPGNLRFK